MNAEQARACPRCAGDKRARHIYPTCARTALLAAIRDREQRARGKGWLAGAIAVYLHEGRTHDRAEHAAHWLYGRALSEREEG